MGNLTVTVTVDGRNIPDSEIFKLHLERAQKTLSDMLELGAAPTFNGVDIKQSEIDKFDLQQAKDSLLETKLRLGNDGLRSIYKDELLASDQMWREIAAASPSDRDFQPSMAEIVADGLTLGEFMTAFSGMMIKKDLSMFFDIHPEHFITEFPKLGQATCMEVVGMYGGPTYMAMDMTTRGKGFRPIPIDSDTKVAMLGNGRLMSDGTSMKLFGLHQFKATARGMMLKAGIFFPAATPKEMVEGHKMHLAVEMSNGMRFAHHAKASVMPFLIDTVLRFTKL